MYSERKIKKDERKLDSGDQIGGNYENYLF